MTLEYRTPAAKLGEIVASMSCKRVTHDVSGMDRSSCRVLDRLPIAFMMCPFDQTLGPEPLVHFFRPNPT